MTTINPNYTIRKKILDAMIEYIRADEWIISGSVSVNPGKTRYKKTEMPGVSVFVGQEQGEKAGYDVQGCSMEIEFKYVGLLASGDDVFEITENIRGKLINSAMNANDDWSTEKEYAGGTIDYPATDDEAYQVSVLINVKYQTELLNPYSQGD